MPDEDVYLETEDAEEWVYCTVMGDGGGVGVLGVIAEWLRRLSRDFIVVCAIEDALDEALAEGEEVTEEDIDESIEDDLSSLREDYEEGEISKEEYKEACLYAKNREAARQDLIEVDLHIRLGDGYAASELLAALLGNPGIVYECVIEPTDDAAINATKVKFESKVRKIGQDHEDSLKQLVPNALKVVKRLKEDEALEAMGIQMGEKDDCVRAWMDAYNQLERNLTASQ